MHRGTALLKPSGKRVWTSSDQKKRGAPGKKIGFKAVGNGELLKLAKWDTGVIGASGRCEDGWCRQRLETSLGTMGSSCVNGHRKQEKLKRS